MDSSRTTKLYLKPGWAGCKRAREFLVDKGVDLVQRNIFKDRLTEEEIVDLGERAGGVASLVPRKQRDEVGGMSEEEITRYLAGDPSRIKRPIIDTGDHVYIGFNQTVQQQLEAWGAAGTASASAMNDEDYMRLALEEAHAAMLHDDVPVGAVAVSGGQVVATAHNERELLGDPTAHAEVLVLRRAAERMKSWQLRGLSVYVTLEPCPMCAGALVAARIKRVVYGTPDLRAGAVYSLYNIVQDPRLNHRCEVTVGILEEQCSEVLESFFQSKRGVPGFL